MTTIAINKKRRRDDADHDDEHTPLQNTLELLKPLKPGEDAKLRWRSLPVHPVVDQWRIGVDVISQIVNDFLPDKDAVCFMSADARLLCTLMPRYKVKARTDIETGSRKYTVKPMFSRLKVRPHELFREVASWIGDFPHLESLDLSKIPAAVEYVDASNKIVSSLHHFPRLRKLDLSGNKAEGLLDSLARSLPGIPYLESLDIQLTEAKSFECVALSNSLRHCPRMKVFFVGGSPISHESAYAFVQALQHFPELDDLGFSFTDMNEATAGLLARNLLLVPRLTGLYLHYTCIPPKSMCSILTSCGHLREMNDLDIGGYSLDMDATRLLVEAILRMPSLEVLRVDVRDAGPPGASLLVEALKKIDTLRNVGVTSRGMVADEWIKILPRFKGVPLFLPVWISDASLSLSDRQRISAVLNEMR
jgi:hypothetical protein